MASVSEAATADAEKLKDYRLPVERKASTIDQTILSPGTVSINVQGAFIVDEDPSNPPTPCNDGAQHDTDIRLPNHKAIVSHVALDIGGSLAKLVYFSQEPHSSELGGRLNFLKYETDQIDQCLGFIKRLQNEYQTQNGSRSAKMSIMATGGGAYKYYDEMRRVLGVEILREDEMDCLIIGLDFFITEIPREVFTYNDIDPMHFEEARADIYPYLLVNIGSGVSMIKVSGPRKFERIGGTSLGGGTLWGLLSLLTGARTFDDMLKMAEVGDNAAVDMLVGDIYGADYSKIGLKSTTIASSFGKVFKLKRQGESQAEDHGGLSHETHEDSNDASTSQPVFKPEDISRSLLYAVSNNIGQIAYLQSEKHNLEHIYFGGSFIRGHRQTIQTLSYAINFWSKGEKKAYFLRHEGYLGSVGAFLKRQPRNWGRRNSFEEYPVVRPTIQHRED
ncbi:MAG: hypothetical protein LQ338_003340 [Usnochroma carphineum]|nr:MAG: hypothetical protein LQ338_003340 [Usnochroma carphineum]